MALEYTLMIDSRFGLAELTRILSNREGFEYQSDCLKVAGITIHMELADQDDKAFAKDYFHFVPNLAVFFTQDKLTDFRLAHSNLIKTTVILLNECSGDAMLDFNGDTVLLRKIKHQLLLYQDDSDFWQPFLLNLIPQPYEFATHNNERDSTYSADLECHSPIYLEPTVAKLINQIALKKHKSMGEIVNAWLKKDLELGQNQEYQ